MINQILCGDSLEILKTLPNESVNCVMTSPPYWALRDYGVEGVIWDGDKNCEHNFEIKENKNPMDRGGKGQHDNSGIVGKMGELTQTIVQNGFCTKCRAWKGHGAGTTGLVALKQNKQFIGIELNPEYIKIAKERLKPFLEQKKI